MISDQIQAASTELLDIKRAWLIPLLLLLLNLPVKQPDASLERNIDDIERKRTKDESKVFEQVGVYIGFCTNFSAQIVRMCK